MERLSAEASRSSERRPAVRLLPADLGVRFRDAASIVSLAPAVVERSVYSEQACVVSSSSGWKMRVDSASGVPAIDGTREGRPRLRWAP